MQVREVLRDLDEKHSSEQIFIGMKDFGITAEKKDLSDVTGIQTEGEKSGTEKICAYDPEYKGFRLREVVTSINVLSGKAGEPPSWMGIIYEEWGARIVPSPCHRRAC